MKSRAYVVFGQPRSLQGPTGVLQGRDNSVSVKEKRSMQPPLIRPFIRDAVNRLSQEASFTVTSHSTALAAHGSISDIYVMQIKNWAERLTPAQLARRYSIDEIMALADLKGRYREHASVRYTGEALRRCGFVTKRDWTAAGRNKRFWVKGIEA